MRAAFRLACSFRRTPPPQTVHGCVSSPPQGTLDKRWPRSAAQTLCLCSGLVSNFAKYGKPTRERKRLLRRKTHRHLLWGERHTGIYYEAKNTQTFIMRRKAHRHLLRRVVTTETKAARMKLWIVVSSWNYETPSWLYPALFCRFHTHTSNCAVINNTAVGRSSISLLCINEDRSM